MPRQVKLSPHLTPAELDAAIQSSLDPIQRRRLRAIRRLQDGVAARDVAAEFQKSRAWLSTAIRLYNDGGVDGLRDRRHENSGRPMLLSASQLEQVEQALQHPPEEGGRWNGAKLTRWVHKNLAIKVHRTWGAMYLRRKGWTCRPLAPPPQDHAQQAAQQQRTEHEPKAAPFSSASRAPSGLPFAKTPYPSDLTDEQWAILETLLPARNSATSLRRVVDAVLYVLRTGCPWDYLPRDFPPLGTVKTIFYEWVERGVWPEVVAVLRERWRVRVGRDVCPSLGLIDSQSVKTCEKGGLEVTMEERK